MQIYSVFALTALQMISSVSGCGLNMQIYSVFALTALQMIPNIFFKNIIEAGVEDCGGLEGERNKNGVFNILVAENFLYSIIRTTYIPIPKYHYQVISSIINRYHES